MADIMARGMSADAKAYTNSVLITGQKPCGTLNSVSEIPATASVGDWYTCNFTDAELGIAAGNRILFNTTTTYVVDTYAINGKDGLDGVSPTATVSKTGKVTTLSITDANGTTSVEINDGEDGSGGGSAYILPLANSTTLGGVKPVSKTGFMTQEVGVDNNGKLYTEPSTGGSADLSKLDLSLSGTTLKVNNNGTPQGTGITIPTASQADIEAGVSTYLTENPVSMDGYIAQESYKLNLPTTPYSGTYYSRYSNTQTASGGKCSVCYDNSNGGLDGKKIYVTGATGGNNGNALIVFRNATTELSFFWDGGNMTYTEKEFTVPVGTIYIYVNGSTTVLPSIKVIKYKNVAKIDDVNNVFDNGYEYKNAPSTISAGLYVATAYGVDATKTGYSCAYYTLPSGTTKVKLSGASGGASAFPFYTFTNDTNGEILSLYEQANKSYNNVIVQVPDGATKIYVNGSGTTAPSIQIAVKNIRTDITFSKAMFETLGKRAMRPMDFAWKTRDKGYFVFTYDDSLVGQSLIEDLFEELQVPCCFAAVPGKLNTIATSGETIKAVYDRCIANGGEILNHSHTTVTASNITDFNMLYEKFLIDKKIFEDAGFNIRGIIRAGGDGQLDGDIRTEPWCRLFYDYSDLYGTAEPYNHARVAVYNNLDTMKAIVDSTIANNGFTVFLNHNILGLTNPSTGEMDEATTRALIAYIKAQGGVITNYATVYDNFGTTKDKAKLAELEARILALETP